MDNSIHSLVVENKKKLSVTLAKEVTSFSDKEIKIKLRSGSVLLVVGDGLKITAFDESSGNFIAVGNIQGTRYKDAGENLLKKVFK